jgi:hypothetical protein
MKGKGKERKENGIKILNRNLKILKSDIPLSAHVSKGVKTVRTALFVVFIATCFEPEGLSSG